MQAFVEEVKNQLTCGIPEPCMLFLERLGGEVDALLRWADCRVVKAGGVGLRWQVSPGETGWEVAEPGTELGKVDAGIRAFAGLKAEGLLEIHGRNFVVELLDLTGFSRKVKPVILLKRRLVGGGPDTLIRRCSLGNAVRETQAVQKIIGFGALGSALNGESGERAIRLRHVKGQQNRAVADEGVYFECHWAFLQVNRFFLGRQRHLEEALNLQHKVNNTARSFHLGRLNFRFSGQV